MGKYVIHPLNLGTITRDKSMMAYMTEPGKIVELPVFAWYLTDGDEKILVDTGGIVPDGKRFMPYRQSEKQQLPHALAALGVSCDEIDTVILTHLHWDHASNNHLFPQARIYVQKKELQYAAAPIPIHRKSYDPRQIFSSSYEIIDGDVRFRPGILLALTSGHSPGSQTVVVDTTAGKYALVGDLINFLECWTASPKIPNGFHTDLVETYRSFEKVESFGATLLAAHEPAVLSHARYPG